MRRADPFIIRLIFGFKRPRKPILGVVVAGEIEALGESVSKYKIGDQVFGSNGMNFGVTASMHFLRIANIQQDQKVLIYGASGALGTMAIQLAKNSGAEITAVCSTANIELTKSLGADYVIDYTQKDFTRNGKKYDVVFDTIGKSTLRKALKSLSDNGYLLFASAGLGTMIGGSIKSMFIKKKIVSGVIKETVKDMNFFK